jgi:hypothetical protein
LTPARCGRDLGAMNRDGGRRRSQEPTPLGNLLQTARTSSARAARVVIERELWMQVVGYRIAERAQPVQAQAGVLTIQVASAVWAQELSLLSSDILQRLKKAGLDFKSLRFRVVQAARKPVQERVAPRAPRAPLPAELNARLADLEDDALRATIAEAAGLSLGLRRKDGAKSANARPKLTSKQPDARAPRSAAPRSAHSDRRSSAPRGARPRTREEPED